MEVEITATKVYDIGESIIASGFPMTTSYDADLFEDSSRWLQYLVNHDFPSAQTHEDAEDQIKRARKLASNPADSGHGNFLKGIRVSMNVTGPIKWWIEAQRYSHFDIVSSQSTMHRGIRFNLRNMLPRGFPDELIKLLEGYQAAVVRGELTAQEFVKMLPAALEYTGRVSTNYMQLKIMYQQRKNHALKEWHIFCDWCSGLPLPDLITGGE